MRVVLDTNILLSALLKKGSPPDRIRRAWEARRFTVVTSRGQLAELSRVSRYPRLRLLLKPHEVGRLILRLQRYAEVLTDLPTVDLAPDPDDNPILATAIAGRVDVLVTGDRADLLALSRVQGIPVVTARGFLERFVS
ncbi:MAG: putative toxin-antitoxin system toxin component, PIN family [Trueperaceae bacterium]|nr:MAG: putative toxin-antitoxin system toxin component, PIN family [Trueperaceae bacterium]